MPGEQYHYIFIHNIKFLLKSLKYLKYWFKDHISSIKMIESVVAVYK